ncbi:MAG TPA: ribonuclease H [Kofleriaceae bacterium]|nr:ribonuclease H [Kofleriaceae bacterium]
MPWIKHRLRDADVWAKVDAGGQLVTDRDGRVEIVYKPVDGAKTYRAGARNLSPVAGEKPVELEAGERAPDKQQQASQASQPAADAIQVWTDGACSGNPGPAGLGVVILDGKHRTELSEYLGEGTNNIAELTAILRGLETLKDKSRPVVVYSDSSYSIDILTKAWKAKKNVELIDELRAVCRTFADLRFVKVAGHAGVPLNERCDQLAREAITRRR